jgi:hypothetical protein
MMGSDWTSAVESDKERAGIGKVDCYPLKEPGFVKDKRRNDLNVSLGWGWR